MHTLVPYLLHAIPLLLLHSAKLPDKPCITLTVLDLYGSYSNILFGNLAALVLKGVALIVPLSFRRETFPSNRGREREYQLFNKPWIILHLKFQISSIDVSLVLTKPTHKEDHGKFYDRPFASPPNHYSSFL